MYSCLKIVLSRKSDTKKVGFCLARIILYLQKENIWHSKCFQFHLKGDIGTGKTTIIRYILYGLGYKGYVNSPTYSLVQSYIVQKIKIYHFDLYRISNLNELHDSEFREYFNDNTICFIEWPQNAIKFLNFPDIIFSINFDAVFCKTRILTAYACSMLGNKCLKKYQKEFDL